jgi:hypothetical protein
MVRIPRGRLRIPGPLVVPWRTLHLPATGLTASPGVVIGRYAARWPIEVGIVLQDARQVFGAGQAPQPPRRRVHRTIPFTLACQSIATLSMPPPGTTPTSPSTGPPGTRTRTEPSTADMIAKLRRVLIAAKYRPVHPAEPTLAEIHWTVQLAWEGTAA